MKNRLLTPLCFAVLLIAACNNGEKKAEEKSAGDDILESVITENNTGPEASIPDSVDVANAAVISFEEDTYNFGKIEEGKKINHKFEFTNSGKSPLILSDVQAGCGCTTPKFDKKPIKPGETGTIEIGFNSSGQKGVQHKIITVFSNAQPGQAMLHLKGEVQ